jgi:aerobic-type carbon monoxide dehydrogenase small subunit (CoxS/CutS family)
MNDKSSPRKFSRRKFVQGVSTTIIGSYVLTPGVSKISEKLEAETKEIARGKKPLNLIVNKVRYELMIAPETTLAEVLRNELKLTGTKLICNHGECGGCTVLLNGEAIYSCQMLALDAGEKEVTTIEGLLTGEELHPIQKAFVEHDGLQCGYCTPGQIIAAQAILLKNSQPSKEEILTGMSGNLCRCAAYPNILKSVLAAAGHLTEETNR